MRPGAAPRRCIVASPAVRVGDHDLVPRVALRGTTVVYRLRDGSGGRWEAILATDLATGTTRLIARGSARRAARMSDPAVERHPDRLGADRFQGRPVRPLAHPARARRAVGSRR